MMSALGTLVASMGGQLSGFRRPPTQCAMPCVLSTVCLLAGRFGGTVPC